MEFFSRELIILLVVSILDVEKDIRITGTVISSTVSGGFVRVVLVRVVLVAGSGSGSGRGGAIRAQRRRPLLPLPGSRRRREADRFALDLYLEIARSVRSSVCGAFISFHSGFGPLCLSRLVLVSSSS